MACRAVALLLLLLLLPAAVAAPSRQPRYVNQYTLEGDPVAVAVSESDPPYIALATGAGAVLLDPQQKPLWRKPLASLIGVAVTNPDVPQGPWVLAASADRIYLYNSAGDLLLTQASPRPIRSVGITSDGSRIVIAQERYVEVRTRDGATVWTKDVGLPQTHAAIRSDGVVALLGPSSAVLWDPSGNRQVRAISYGDLFDKPDIRRPTGISIAGDEVVIGASDGSYIHDRSPTKQSVYRTSVPATLVGIQVSAKLLATSTGRSIDLRDFFGNRLQAPTPDGDVAAFALSPDGRYLAVALKQRRLVLYDLSAVLPNLLFVNSTPSGTLIVDGEVKGSTPIQVETSPGPHRVVVNNSTLGEVPVTVVVPFGGKADLFLNLSRLAFPSALEVNSVPPGADVAVDGSSLGRTPLTVSLTTGNHTLRVSAPGFAPYSTLLNLSADNLTRLNVTLAPPGRASSADISQQAIPERSAPQEKGRETTWGVKLVSPAPAPAPTQTPEPPGFEAAFAAAALAVAAVFRSRRRV